MRKSRKGKQYKFIKKTHSRRGLAGLLMGVASLAAGGFMAMLSFRVRGNGSVYLGSAGVLSLLCALVAFSLAIKSLGEEDSYKVLPVASFFIGILALGGWISVYVWGFLG